MGLIFRDFCTIKADLPAFRLVCPVCISCIIIHFSKSVVYSSESPAPLRWFYNTTSPPVLSIQDFEKSMLDKQDIV